MPNMMMFYEDSYVVLSPSMSQQFVTHGELCILLGKLLTQYSQELPKELQALDREAQINRLINTGCEFETPEGTWQWYVVRLEK